MNLQQQQPEQEQQETVQSRRNRRKDKIRFEKRMDKLFNTFINVFTRKTDDIAKLVRLLNDNQLSELLVDLRTCVEIFEKEDLDEQKFFEMYSRIYENINDIRNLPQIDSEAQKSVERLLIKILTMKFYKSLKFSECTVKGSRIDVCPVCLDEKEVLEITCHHHLCDECLKQVMGADNSSCPLCRQEFTCSVDINVLSVKSCPNGDVILSHGF